MALHSTLQKFRSILVVSTLFALQATASAADIAGVKYDEVIDLSGSKLQLNGAGVRYKAIFKVYTAGLYVGKKASTLQEVSSQPGAKRISITMLREIDAAELGKLFTRSIEDNIPRAESTRIIPSMLRMGQMFTEYKTLKVGDTFTIDWVPGIGTVITIKGKTYGEPFKEPEFFNALTSIWLGKSPADWQLKEALLGQKKQPA